MHTGQTPHFRQRLLETSTITLDDAYRQDQTLTGLYIKSLEKRDGEEPNMIAAAPIKRHKRADKNIKEKKESYYFCRHAGAAYSGFLQTSKIVHFAKVASGV